MIKRQQEGGGGGFRISRKEIVAGRGTGSLRPKRSDQQNLTGSESDTPEKNPVFFPLFTFTLTYSWFVKNALSPVTKGRIWT